MVKISKQARRKKEHAKFLSKMSIKEKKKILTNARLTVPHMESGIFMKGKSSFSFQRKDDDKLNTLNKARMNEKLSEILSLAKGPSKPYEEITNEEQDVYDTLPYHHPNNLLEENEDSSISPSSGTISDQYERDKPHSITTKRLPNESTNEEETENISQFQNLNFPVKRIYNEDPDAAVYTQFKIFITYFDNSVSLKHMFTTDFISEEKLNLNKKRNISLHSFEKPILDAKDKMMTKEETSDKIPQNQQGERKMKLKENPGDTKNKRNLNQPKLKRNPNYNAFKNIKKVQIVSTLCRPKKCQDELKSNTFYSEYPTKNSQEERTLISNKSECLSSEDVIRKYDKHGVKSNLMNPLNFLKNIFPEKNNFSLSVSRKPCFDGHQFLENASHSFSFSASPKRTMKTTLPLIVSKSSETFNEYKRQNNEARFKVLELDVKNFSPKQDVQKMHTKTHFQTGIKDNDNFNLMFHSENCTSNHLSEPINNYNCNTESKKTHYLHAFQHNKNIDVHQIHKIVNPVHLQEMIKSPELKIPDVNILNHHLYLKSMRNLQVQNSFGETKTCIEGNGNLELVFYGQNQTPYPLNDLIVSDSHDIESHETEDLCSVQHNKNNSVHHIHEIKNPIHSQEITNLEIPVLENQNYKNKLKNKHNFVIPKSFGEIKNRNSSFNLSEDILGSDFWPRRRKIF